MLLCTKKTMLAQPSTLTQKTQKQKIRKKENAQGNPAPGKCRHKNPELSQPGLLHRSETLSLWGGVRDISGEDFECDETVIHYVHM